MNDKVRLSLKVENTVTATLIRRIQVLEEALRAAARNDKSRYEHHEPRPFDGKTPDKGPDGGTIWLTPREIARAVLEEPQLATLSEVLEQGESGVVSRAWTRKLAAARTLRRLKSLETKINEACIAIARDWDDEDMTVVGECDELRGGFEQMVKIFRQTVADAVDPEPAEVDR